MDSMNKSAGYIYTTADVKGKKSDLFRNDNELKMYVKTGKCPEVPQVDPMDYEYNADYINAKIRKSKIH